MGILMETFPELYLDAITIIRKLGMQYLWIDSLCIIQDCKDDWSKEAAKMGDIYWLSYLTVYALSSPDYSHGMLVRRHGLAPVEMPSPNNSNSLEITRAHVSRTAPLFLKGMCTSTMTSIAQALILQRRGDVLGMSCPYS
jgi:hypothetical protein